jgi:hypothetical protein
MPTYTLPDPSGTGYINASGNTLQEAEQTAATARGMASWTGGSYGADSSPTGTQQAGSGGGAGGGTPGAAPTVVSQSGQQLAAGINSLLGAIASGNKQAFDEAVRQFNVSSGLDQSKFDESIRQFNQNYQISQAGLTGQYNGQQTQAAQLQAYNEAIGTAGVTGYFQAPGAAGGTGGAPTQAQYIAARSQQLQGMGWAAGAATQTALSEWNQGLAQSGNVAGGMPASLIPATAGAAPGGVGTPTLAAQAQWANLYGQNAAPTPGEQTLAAQLQYANLYGGSGAAPTAGQTTLAAQQQAYAQQMGAVNAAAAMQANPFRQAQVIGQAGRILQGMPTAGFQAPTTVAGVGTAGGNTQGGMGYLSQLISDIQDPTANQTTAQSWLDATPTPNKIDSTSFLGASPTTQNLILQSMQEKYGLDPTDSLAQIKNTLPAFNAPNTTGVIRRG